WSASPISPPGSGSPLRRLRCKTPLCEASSIRWLARLVALLSNHLWRCPWPADSLDVSELRTQKATWRGGNASAFSAILSREESGDGVRHAKDDLWYKCFAADGS